MPGTRINLLPPCQTYGRRRKPESSPKTAARPAPSALGASARRGSSSRAEHPKPAVAYSEPYPQRRPNADAILPHPPEVRAPARDERSRRIASVRSRAVRERKASVGRTTPRMSTALRYAGAATTGASALPVCESPRLQFSISSVAAAPRPVGSCDAHPTDPTAMPEDGTGAAAFLGSDTVDARRCSSIHATARRRSDDSCWGISSMAALAPWSRTWR